MSITRLNTNPEALLAGTNLAKLEYSMNKTMGQLSTGMRINTASDDPSAIGIINSYVKQFNQIGTVLGNAQNVLGMMQTYDAALSEVGNRLQELSDIAIQATDSTLSGTQRYTLYKSFAAIRDNIVTYAKTVKFNDKPIMYGSGPASAVMGPGITLAFTVEKYMSNGATGAFGTLLTSANTNWTSTVAIASTAVKNVASAINMFSKYRTVIGAQTQAVENMIKTMQNVQVNMSSSLSRVQDVDMAQAISTFTKQQVLAQASTAMLAQANLQPQGVLKLLGM